jgi:peroxiredoxin/Fic family protein
VSRRDRRSCDYAAYLPDPLLERRFVLDGEVAADIADAEASIIRLNAEAIALVDTDALARILLRAESVASSRIEGLEIGTRRLLRAEAVRSMHQPSSDVTATEVLGNIDAMLYGVEQIRPGDAITVDLLLEIHRRLLAGTRLGAHGGSFRQVQNWIGGSDYNPCSADYVPPPHELVPDLMDDLCAFCNTEELPVVVQAALAHAQFETIHPFVDGNGRTGRAIIHLVLRRRGVAPRVLPPVSLVLATLARDYVGGLTASRYLGSPVSSDATRGMNTWLATFAAACVRAAAHAATLESRVVALEGEWRERLDRVRANSATDLLLHRLPGAPVLTAESAATLIGRTFKPANEAIQRLVQAGILHQITIGRRNRAYEASEIIEAFADLERQLASPAGDTRISPPVRAVPRRLSQYAPTMVEVGNKAPDFELPDQDGKSVKLSGLRGRPVVVYFYPKASTPGCTTQACGVRDHHADYQQVDAVVLGISPDTVAKVKKFHDKESLNFALLADEGHHVADTYGVWVEKSMYGKTYFGNERTTFVIGADGKVSRVLRKVKPAEHDRLVLEALGELAPSK